MKKKEPFRRISMKLPEEKIYKVRVLYAIGYKNKDIQKELDISYNTLMEVIGYKGHGTDPHIQSLTDRNKKIFLDWVDGGDTMVALGKKYDISKQRIHQIIKRVRKSEFYKIFMETEKNDKKT